jgi:hypothetical protein
VDCRTWKPAGADRLCVWCVRIPFPCLTWERTCSRSRTSSTFTRQQRARRNHFPALLQRSYGNTDIPAHRRSFADEYRQCSGEATTPASRDYNEYSRVSTAAISSVMPAALGGRFYHDSVARSDREDRQPGDDRAGDKVRAMRFADLVAGAPARKYGQSATSCTSAFPCQTWERATRGRARRGGARGAERACQIAGGNETQSATPDSL